MLDPLGKVLLELRDDTDFGMWSGQRVRGEVPAPGDAQGPGDYQRFAVISTLPGPRERRVPVQYSRFNVRCYGLTPQDAAVGYGYASDALHAQGPRIAGTGSNRLGIYLSFDDTGGEPGSDPRTKQPYMEFVVALIATTQAVAA